MGVILCPEVPVVVKGDPVIVNPEPPVKKPLPPSRVFHLRDIGSLKPLTLKPLTLPNTAPTEGESGHVEVDPRLEKPRELRPVSVRFTPPIELYPAPDAPVETRDVGTTASRLLMRNYHSRSLNFKLKHVGPLVVHFFESTVPLSRPETAIHSAFQGHRKPRPTIGELEMRAAQKGLKVKYTQPPPSTPDPSLGVGKSKVGRVVLPSIHRPI
jgi:hypothetical protein